MEKMEVQEMFMQASNEIYYNRFIGSCNNFKGAIHVIVTDENGKVEHISVK